MLHLDVSQYNEWFLENLKDWCDGGPKKNGWTRTGGSIPFPRHAKLLTARRGMISVDEGLAKNRHEVEKWHIDFLVSEEPMSSTAYYSEYLAMRYTTKEIDIVCSKFRTLYQDMKINGYNQKFPVLVADVQSLNLDLKYFRFDGCHRLASARVLGIDMVPAYIFKLAVDH